MLKRINSQQGSLLIMSFFFILILAGIGAIFLYMVTSDLRMIERLRRSTEAFYVAEAGIENGIYDLRLDFENDTSTHPWTSGDINGITVAFTNTTDYEVLRSNVSIGSGMYSIDVKKAADDEVWLRSTGTVNGVTSQIEAYVKILDLTPWGYAIFAGNGQSGALINGNVDIRGSVLILGDGLAAGDYAVDLGGTAEFVGNNYRTLASSLKALVPALETVVLNGETVETLNAVLRVKKGMVGLSGNSSVGEADVSGNSYKETVDAVYLTDGWGGNQGAASAYSDNGTSQAYDLGDMVSFPSLADPYTDPVSGTSYASYQAYLKSEGYTLTSSDLSNLNSLGSSFSFGDTNGSVSWDGSGNLTIDGILYIDNGDDLSWTDKKKSVTYSGKGSFLVTGDVDLGTNVLTGGNNSFPNSNMGIMTPNSIYLGGNSQRDVMGMFYAEKSVVVNKQTDVIGSIVANYFDMGTNVPALYQVPAAGTNLPPGLIGATNRWYAVTAWIKK